MHSIPYSELSSSPFSYSALFRDYVSNAPSIRRFFPAHFKDASSWKSTLKAVAERSIDRSELVKVLSSQNRAFQCGVRTLANIDLLLNDNAVAVVTGQQVGMFSGPMYTLYKTLSVLSLCDSLSKQHGDYTFIPVFWLEGEDHDFEEAARIGLISGSNDFASVRLGGATGESPKQPRSVGQISFDETLETFLQSVTQTLQPTDFTPRVADLLRTAYKPGMTFTQSFVHMMNILLEDSGVVYIDPNDRDLKVLLRPVFEREIRDTPRSCQMVVHRSEELETEYHAQVKPRPINAFFLHEKGRYPVEPHPDGFALKGIRQHYSKTEMDEILRDHPDRLSPNVVLRPICQDALLPTVAYVAGPSEVAYFAQILPLYDVFGLPAPIIVPRASATIIEEKVEKVLSRFDVTPLELFTQAEQIKTRVAAQVSDFKAEELFGSTSSSIEESLESLRSGITSIDPTLTAVLDGTLAKIASNVEVLKQKTISAQKRQHEVYLRQIDKATLHLAPDGAPQERALNIVYFMNKYGPEIARWLKGELKHDLYKHQLIRL